VATRASRLALAQTRLVVDALRARGEINVEIIPVTTKGDREAERSLTAIGGEGVFVRELFAALADDTADIAVHSLKDLPTELPPDVAAGVVPERDDARDAIVSRDAPIEGIDALPHGARVGTSSLRRAAQLLLRRPDLEIVPLRGNVDTRVRKLREGACDAAVLAYAGLRRADLVDVLAPTPLEPEDMVPAAGQGALFVQCRADDEDTWRTIAPLEHAQSALATSMERAFLAAVGGGCVAPIGVHARIEGEAYQLWAIVAATDGTRALREMRSGSARDAAEARACVESVASDMLQGGAGDLIARARHTERGQV